jgi:hypothetical protein
MKKCWGTRFMTSKVMNIRGYPRIPSGNLLPKELNVQIMRDYDRPRYKPCPFIPQE